MMRKLLLPALAFILMISVSHASLVGWNIDIALNNDKTSEWLVSLYYNEPVTQSDYFIRSTLTDYTVQADGLVIPCRLETAAGTSILCEGFSAMNLTYRFVTTPVTIDILDNFNLFTHRFSIDQQTDYFSVRVRLPIGSVLADANELRGGLKPFEPPYGLQSSDGRYIFITWPVSGPEINKTLDVSVVYEQLGVPSQDTTLLFVIIGVLVISVGGFIFYFKGRQPIQDVLPILTEGERRVMEILLREKGSVDQRVIVKETDFSKAKVSRIIQDLVQRGLIEKILKGRKNLIKLKKTFKQPKNSTLETKENREQK